MHLESFQCWGEKSGFEGFAVLEVSRMQPALLSCWQV